MKEYNNYYNKLATFKVNKDVKEKTQKLLIEDEITFQDFIDDAMREYLKEKNVKIPARIRKSIEITK
jgi:hypothetical protein